MSYILEPFEITPDVEDFCRKEAKKFTKREIIILCKKTKCTVQIYKYNLYRSYEEHKMKQCEKSGIDVMKYREKILQKIYTRFQMKFSHYYNDYYLPREEKRKLSAVTYFKMRCVQFYFILCFHESNTPSSNKKNSIEEEYSNGDSESDNSVSSNSLDLIELPNNRLLAQNNTEIDPEFANYLINNIEDANDNSLNSTVILEISDEPLDRPNNAEINPELAKYSITNSKDENDNSLKSSVLFDSNVKSLDMDTGFANFVINNMEDSNDNSLLSIAIVESQPTYEEFNCNVRNLSYTSTQNLQT